ncbi:MAG: type II secretion system GspH family protein [Chthoniobacter sp.]|nr:type II secretion system GspH family protein [Chthoniobacter sp.]
MNSHPHRRSNAFTLVELLTVIAIIAILMGLLFPALNNAKDQARKTEARSACMGILAAVKAYNTEYNKYPYPLTGTAPATAADVIAGDTTVGGAAGGNENLFNTLRAKSAGTNANHVLNPRRISFFEGKDATSATAPKGGFVTTGSSAGAFFDPWGAQYCVAIDLDYDNQLTTLPYTDFKTTTTYPQTGVGVYSLGKDGKLGVGGKFKDGSTNSDDIISWQ